MVPTMNSAKTGLVVLLILLGGLCAYLLLQGRPTEGHSDPLVLHCAAGMRVPVKEIVEQYEAEYGVKVAVVYGGSGQLASQLKIAGGDLYLPADISYIALTRDQGQVQESIPITFLTAGIAVRRGNPNQVRTLADLERKELRVGLGDPSAAIGKFTKKVLGDLGRWEAVRRNVTVLKPTVNNVAEDVAISAIDAGIVWDAVAAMFEDVEFINVPVFDERRKQAQIAVLTSSANPTAALRFARYLAARDRGLEIFKQHGFDVVAGDKWESVPEVSFFSGSMLRPAITKQLKAFQQREGVRVNVVYEGCGTLVSQMQAGARPDGYFSCATQFLDMMGDDFEAGTVISKNEIVLLVPKSNPKQIKLLQDLRRPDLKLGVAHPEKSALGYLTKQMLDDVELWQPIHEAGNIVVLVSKGDELVNQMQVGALDAALVYRSNALASSQIMDSCEIIQVNMPEAFAEQPYAVSRNSNHKHLMRRLQDALTGSIGKQEFLRYGFDWQLNES